MIWTVRDPRTDTIGERLVLLAILAGSALLVFWDLDRTSLWLDEAASLRQSHRGFLDMLVHTARDNYPPLHNIILWTNIRLFGLSEAAVRFPSAILAVTAVYAIYRLGKCAWGGREGLIAALLLALLPEHIWHGSEARMYPLLSLTAICFVWATLTHFNGASRHSAILAAAAGFLLLMSHIYGAFVFASVNLFVLSAVWRTGRWHDGPSRSWLKWQLLAMIAFAPWMVLLALRAGNVVTGGFWIPYPDFEYLINTAVSLFTRPLLYAGIGLFFTAALLSLLKLFQQETSQNQRSSSLNKVWLTIVWFIGPFAIAYAISVLALPILHTKYLVACAPAALLLVAHAITSLPLPTIFKAVIPLFIAAKMLPISIDRAILDVHERHDMRAAVAAINTQLQAGDRFHLHPWYFEALFAYYKNNDPTNLVYARAPKNHSQKPAEGRVWVMVADDDKDAAQDILNSYKHQGYQLDGSQEFNRLTIYLLKAERQ